VPRAVLDALEEFRRRPAAEVLAAKRPERTLTELRLLLENWLEQALERRFRAAAPMEREISRATRA
jgi:hypothetical protein